MAELRAVREVIQREIELRAKEHARYHEAEKDAVDLARKGIEHRLESMNEFRAELTRLTTTFLGRDELDRLARERGAQIEAMNTRMRTLEQSNANLQGRVIVSGAILAALLTGGTILVNILA